MLLFVAYVLRTHTGYFGEDNQITVLCTAVLEPSCYMEHLLVYMSLKKYKYLQSAMCKALYDRNRDGMGQRK